jgi:hypothetical protein
VVKSVPSSDPFFTSGPAVPQSTSLRFQVFITPRSFTNCIVNGSTLPVRIAKQDFGGLTGPVRRIPAGSGGRGGFGLRREHHPLRHQFAVDGSSECAMGCSPERHLWTRVVSGTSLHPSPLAQPPQVSHPYTANTLCCSGTRGGLGKRTSVSGTVNYVCKPGCRSKSLLQRYGGFGQETVTNETTVIQPSAVGNLTGKRRIS